MGKTVLVTGATDGIGLETARQLSQRGYAVILHGRSDERLRQARDSLASTSAPAAAVEIVRADLSVMDEVRAMATALRARHARIDVLIHNAGVYETSRGLTGDGFERTMAVNHFAPFLLTQQLLACLQAAPQGRIVVVSSVAHTRAAIDLDDLSFAKGYSGYGAYATSKLANVLFAGELARRLAGSACTANCLHPGVISTKLLRKGFDLGGEAVERGARTSVFLADAPEVAHVSGAYFVDCRAEAPAPLAQDAALAAGLWARTETLLRKWRLPQSDTG